MAEYIEREIALDIVKRTSGDYAAAFAEIAHHPAADVEPVRHGRWIEYQTPHIICCSCCDWGTGLNGKTDFCPNCGAKMDGGQDDG